MFRILLNAILILSVFLLPVYISFFLIFLSIIIFDNFIEAIVWGFLIDLLYGSGSVYGIHFAYFFTSITFVAYLISLKIKPMIRLSSQ